VGVERELGTWSLVAAASLAEVQIGERGREMKVSHHTSGALVRERQEFVPA